MYSLIKRIALFYIFCLSLQIANANALPDDNQAFRNAIIAYVRAVANHHLFKAPLPPSSLNTHWDDLYQGFHWSVEITIYYQGLELTKASAGDEPLETVIKLATERALTQVHLPEITQKELDAFRFKVRFDYYPNQYFAFIEYQGKGLELLGNRVAIRSLDTKLIKEQIRNSKLYLLHAMDPIHHGFFKSYDAKNDKHQNRLRTIYSASSLYTLMKLDQLQPKLNLEKTFKPIAAFILSMQISSGENAGALYYSYDPKTNKKSSHVVVGTASKTIFTLLELAHRYPQEPYLAAAKKAGDWLLSMIKPNGEVIAIAWYKNNRWTHDAHQSFLYSGQVLSALSRLYAVTKEPRYYKGATKIAKRFYHQAREQHLFLGDDYRPKNSISTSWVLMSMIDYAKINEAPPYRELILGLAKLLLSMQIRDRHDLFLYGRYYDSRKPSGNGWINEVFGNLYEFCQSTNLTDCTQYKKPMLLSARWLMQNAYNQTNSYAVKNPAQARGGFIRYFSDETVRTDAVCHGVNSLMMLLKLLGEKEGSLLFIPEKPLAYILPSLRGGKGFYA